MNRPNFFIVGAPKCGTTAMNDFLCRHPQVFMAGKELHFFGADLSFRERISEADYHGQFAAAGNARVRGEASVWYLYSHNAAAEIHRYNPSARILIMLRNPVTVLHSLHSQHLYDGNEVEPSFEKALELDAERKEGRSLPDAVDYHRLPSYFDAVDFAPQVQRFLDVFGKDQVHIVWHDDFTADPSGEVAKVVQFLGLEPLADMSFGRINANRNIKNLWLHRLIKKPPAGLRRLVRWVMPVRSIRHRVMLGLFTHNLETARRTELHEALKIQLQQRLAPGIVALQALTGHSLAHWLPTGGTAGKNQPGS